MFIVSDYFPPVIHFHLLGLCYAFLSSVEMLGAPVAAVLRFIKKLRSFPKCSVNSVTKIFVITAKGLELVTSCVKDQDATTTLEKHK